jgi:starch synthase
MKVLFVSGELAPFAKVGGLADVAAALPAALFELGADIRIIIPRYGIIDSEKYPMEKILSGIEVEFKGEKNKINLFKTALPGGNVAVYLIENDRYLSKGDIYLSQDASSCGNETEFERFGFFTVSVLEILKNLEWQPQIIHCNDWHTGLLPLLAPKNFRTITTIHNSAYQGRYREEIVLSALGKDKKIFHPKDGHIIALREAILSSDFINTVSLTYAKEILTEEFGCGLEKDLEIRKKDLFGILNGLDINLFNPETDTYIFRNFSVNNISARDENKTNLRKILGLADDKDIPVFGFVGRLTEQKGFDILIPALEEMLGENAQVVILGSGSKNYEEKLMVLARKAGTAKISLNFRFDAELAQKIYGGSDFFLVPSRFEPCGLIQMIAMRYGAVPLARRTGGLRDTVIDYAEPGGNGIVFEKYDTKDLLEALKKAMEIYQEKEKLLILRKNGMTADFSWRKSARKYFELYQKLIFPQ